MAVQVREREGVAGDLRVPGSRRTPGHAVVATLVVIAILVGAVGGWLAYRSGIDRRRADGIATAQQIEQVRSARMVEYWERRWAAEHALPGAGDPIGPIRITGTGPGLVRVAEMQAAFARTAVTGTGPGLETVAEAASTAPSDAVVVVVP